MAKVLMTFRVALSSTAGLAFETYEDVDWIGLTINVSLEADVDGMWSTTDDAILCPLLVLLQATSLGAILILRFRKTFTMPE